MYRNKEFEFLQSNQKRLANSELDVLIEKINTYYNDFNKNYSKYTKNYINTMTSIMNEFHIKQLITTNFSENFHVNQKNSEEVYKILQVTKAYYDNLFNLRYLSFLSEEKRNIIFVGPNGSGKTTLLRHLIKLTGEKDIAYFQADRLLLINSNYSPERDENVFNTTMKTTYKQATDVSNGNQGYYINLQLNQIISLFEKKRASELERVYKEKNLELKCKTQDILDAWNDLIKDRELYCDGTLKVRIKNKDPYEIKFLSSGEKSIFYFLASIILQDEKKYYFIDEPENNLNPSVVSRLWNILEKNRPNSNFVYLTHDSEFVASRINCKVYWIQKYDGVNWKYKSLPENDNLPQSLMINLIGNKQSVLFCESQDENKYDTMFYKLMFPEFKVISSGGCSKVISKVKAYKSIGLPQTSYGIIDCDYRKQSYLDGQKENKIYYVPFFEIENFLMCEEILKEVLAEYSTNPEETFEQVLKFLSSEFENNKEKFIIRNVATRLHELGFTDRIKNLNSRSELEERFNLFISEIDLNAMFDDYEI